jgi:transcriptional regulator with XRE-family HTH domain
MALSLIRQREKSGSTVREAAQRLGSTSPNSYAQYEKGKTRISLDHYEKLLQAANPQKHSLLRVI